MSQETRHNYLGFYHHDGGMTKIVGRFTVDAAPAVNCVDLHGNGYTAAVTAAGRYTITFNDAYLQLLHADCTIQAALGNVDAFGQVGAFTPGVAPTLVLRCMTGAVETDVVVGDYVCFEATLYSEWIDP